MIDKQIATIGKNLFDETVKGLGEDAKFLNDAGSEALIEITALLAECAVRKQMGEDVSIMENALKAALGNWESVAYVTAADRADKVRAGVMEALGSALEIVLLVGLKAVIPV